MVALKDLGFYKGAIAEIILSTVSVEGQPNAAPMGVTMHDEHHLTVDLFNTSQTYSNIKEKRCGVINLTGDIEVFYRSTFKEANPNSKLPKEWFEPAEIVEAPRLGIADATVEVSVERLEFLRTGRTRAFLEVETIKATQRYPQVINRAFNLVLEAIIDATRVKAFLNNPKEQAQVVKLLGDISDCHQVVNRVAPNSEYSKVMDDLVGMVEDWRRLK